MCMSEKVFIANGTLEIGRVTGKFAVDVFGNLGGGTIALFYTTYSKDGSLNNSLPIMDGSTPLTFSAPGRQAIEEYANGILEAELTGATSPNVVVRLQE